MKRYMFVLLSVFICFPTLYAQSKSAIEFYDTTGSEPVSRIGWTGDKDNGHFFIETPDKEDEIKVQNGNLEVNGTVKAAKFEGDGSGLTGISSEVKVADSSKTVADSSISSKKIKNSSIKSIHISEKAVTAEKIDDNAVNTTHITDQAVTDEKIDSVSWDKIKGIPEGFADGIDNTGESSSDSARASGISDSTRKIPDAIVTSDKVKDGAIKDKHIESVDWSKIDSKPDNYPVKWDSIPNKPSHYRTHSDSIEWKSGSTGHVWKMDNGEPGWAPDEKGVTKVAIDSVSGLKDSLTAHRNLVNNKADKSHSHSISDIKGLNDTIKTHSNSLASLNGLIKTASNTLKRLDGSVRVISNTSPQSKLSVTINDPSSGYMLVTASAEVAARSNDPSGSTYWALDGSIRKNVSDGTAESHNIHWNTSTKSLPYVWTQTTLLHFTASEQKTAYLMFNIADCEDCGNVGLYNAIITAIFIRDNQ
ncbi:MAG: hypothetical protein GXY77_13250 [Fibrobacter sp.]|nr:hypothetical protein [Fibrobacter sp.]